MVWKYVDKSAGPNACWPWIGARTYQDYGAFGVLKKTYRAHRLIYEIVNGTFDKSLLVCHRCDNPPCCNPAHLFLGTHADNAQDKNNKGRQSRGEKNGRAKLTARNVLFIRLRYEPRDAVFGAKPLAARFNVSDRLIQQIVANKIWKKTLAKRNSGVLL